MDGKLLEKIFNCHLSTGCLILERVTNDFRTKKLFRRNYWADLDETWYK